MDGLSLDGRTAVVTGGAGALGAAICRDLAGLGAHVVVADGLDHSMVLGQVRQLLNERFGIDHVTIQIEPAGFEERKSCN